MSPDVKRSGPVRASLSVVNLISAANQQGPNCYERLWGFRWAHRHTALSTPRDRHNFTIGVRTLRLRGWNVQPDL